MRHKSRMGGGHRFDFFMSLSPTNDMYCFTGKNPNPNPIPNPNSGPDQVG